MSCLKSFGGTGILPSGAQVENLCHQRAGTDARPTNLFMFYGWTKGPGATALNALPT